MMELRAKALETMDAGGTVKILYYTGTHSSRPPFKAFAAPDCLPPECIPRYRIFRKDPCRPLWIEYTSDCPTHHDVMNTESAITGRISSRLAFDAAHTINLLGADGSVHASYRRYEIAP
jgi:hypothetical protein